MSIHRTTEAPEQSNGHPGTVDAVAKFEENCAAIGSIFEQHNNEIVRLRKYVARLEDAINEVRDELAEDFDINANGGPNKAMSLSNTLGEALYGPGGF